jgi:hypothetical protein
MISPAHNALLDDEGRSRSRQYRCGDQSEQVHADKQMDSRTDGQTDSLQVPARLSVPV